MGSYDVQQVCLNGHQITDNFYRSPEFRQQFCRTCGAETIHKCPECGTEIKGDYHVEGVIGLGGSTSVPTHCEQCGKPFPWTNKGIFSSKKKSKGSDCSLRYDEKVTFKWLWENVPAAMWFKSGSILLFAFTLGVYVTSVPAGKSLLKKIPGFEVNNVVSKEAQDDIQRETNILITAHSQRLGQLQNQLLEEERLGADHNIIPSYQEFHQNSAQRIRGLIQAENESFEREVKSLNVFISQLR